MWIVAVTNSMTQNHLAEGKYHQWTLKAINIEHFSYAFTSIAAICKMLSIDLLCASED